MICLFVSFFFMLRLLQYCNYIIIVMQIKLMLLLLNRLWYHSILRGSIDPKHAKRNEIWRQNIEIHSAFACSRWPPWFPDLSRPYGACVKRGSRKHMFGLSLFRPSRQSNISQSNVISQMPYPRAYKDNHALLPPLYRHEVDRCIICRKQPMS